MGYKTLSIEEHTALLKKVGNMYMPKEEKKKPKLTLKQIFFLKKNAKK
tara:strand:- start:374 stop:517 length:144 start_codon:yes stop_codon:yes gene_type:complete